MLNSRVIPPSFWLVNLTRRDIVDIGTPAQSVKVQLDTGSDELWLDPDCSAVSNTASAQFCSTVGVYDPTKSSTFTDLDQTKPLAYGIGEVQIEYVTDNVVISGSCTSSSWASVPCDVCMVA